jgi:GDP-L-fucose synthase
MNSSDTILITGASGMIGSALFRILREEGYTRLLVPSHAELDLRDAGRTEAYFAQHKPDRVFHLAARVGGIHANNTYPAQFIYDNTVMQASVFEAARKSGVKKLLFPGSACTYPRLAPQPVQEKEFMNGPVEPTNIAYASAKMNGIIMAQSYAREYGMNIIIPMPANTYGIGDNFNPEASHVIPALMQRFHEARQKSLSKVVIWGSGKPLREFIYVDDVARAFIFLMQNYDFHDITNVGTMQEISIGELASGVARVVGYTGNILLDPAKPDGAPRKVLDSSRLFGLGWKPRINLDEGLRRMHEVHFAAMAA